MSTADEVRQKLEEKLKIKRTEEVKAQEEPKTEAPQEPTPEDAEEIRAAKKARLVQVLSRGMLSDKLKSISQAAVPEGYVGKFVRDRSEDIIRYTAIGYGFTYKEGAPTGLHDPATNHIRVGDLVLMTVQKETHELLREIQADRVKNDLNRSRREYLSEARKEAERGGAVPFDESTVVIDKATIIDKR